MKKGIIFEIKNEYTYVLFPNTKMKKIKREYYHEIGQEITIPFFTMRRVIPTVLVTCLLVIAIISNPFQEENTVQALSYVTLKVNPGLVLKVDEKGRIAAVSYTNADGQQLTQQIDFVNQTLEDSVTLFIDYCFDNHYFQDNNKIDINVMSDDVSQIKSLEKQVNDIINNYLKNHQVQISFSLDEVSSTQKTEAKSLGVPDSKMKLIDLVLKYYPKLNKNDLAKKSIDDLMDYLEDTGLDEDMLDKMEDELEKKEEKKEENKKPSQPSSNNKDDKGDDDDDDDDDDNDDDNDEDD